MAGPRNATTTSKGRVYTWTTGESFPSVTTILGDGLPKNLTDWSATMAALCGYRYHGVIGDLIGRGGELTIDYHGWKAEWWALSKYDRDKVSEWASFILNGADADRVPDEYAQLVAIHLMRNAHLRDRDAAASQGSKVHDWAERISLGLATFDDIPAKQAYLRPYVQSFVRFLEDWEPEYEASEMTVYSRKYGYAGTLDFIARLPGLGLVLGDYKTNRSGLFGDMALQLAAYRYADFIGLPDGNEAPMLEVDSCVGLHISPTDYQVVPVKADEDAFEYFRHVSHVARWTTAENKEALGKPLPSPRKETAK